jgi:molybdate transport system substrate-binding protein
MVAGSMLAVALLVLVLWSPWSRSSTESGESLVLYCAAGISPPVEALIKEYEAAYGARVQVEYAGSGQLASKIKAAPDRGDLYLSADAMHIDDLRSQSPPLVRETMPVAWQRPVIALSRSGQGKVRGLDDLLKDDVKVVIANPATSIGLVTEDVLTDTGHWPRLQEQMKRFEAKVSLAGTVNEVAQALQLGAADAGIVWDATAEQRGLKYLRVPALEAAQQQIQIAVLSSAANPTAALRFARYLTSRDKGQPHFIKHKYQPIEDADNWAERPTIDVMSGAMLRPGVEQTLAAFQAREGVEINVVYNGCGILITQMRGGTHPDAYFSCDVSFMDQVRELFDPPVTISENDLVVLVPKGQDKVRSLDDLTNPGLRVGVGHPKNSALGTLTEQLLERTGQRQSLQESGNLKVESATGDFLVNQVVTGALDAAIVYRSNAVANPDNLRESIDVVPIDVPNAFAAQPIAAARNSRHKHLVGRLLKSLESQESRERMESVGFRWKGPSP